MEHLPEDRNKPKPLTLSMLTSEGVYKLVVVIERLIRWLARVVWRPCLLQLRCLFW